MRGASAVLAAGKLDVQSALPQYVLPEWTELVDPVHDRQEVVARELAHDAGEARAAVREQQLRFADPARVPEHLPGGREGRRVLGLAVEPDVEVAERDPRRLAAPAHVDD